MILLCTVYFSTMHYSSVPPAGCRNTIFSLADSDIPAVEDGSSTIFLGKPIDAFIPRDLATVEKLKQKALKIMTSKLAPWQRIDCMKTFFYPSLQFLLRTDQILKTDWTAIDDMLKPLYKKSLGLPPNAANAYLYGSHEDGLFAIPVAAEDSDIAQLDNSSWTFKLLTSKDKIVKMMAWAELKDNADWRLGSTNMENKQDFLNSEPGARNSNKYKSPWTRARIASDHLKVKWQINEQLQVSLHAGEGCP